MGTQVRVLGISGNKMKASEIKAKRTQIERLRELTIEKKREQITLEQDHDENPVRDLQNNLDELETNFNEQVLNLEERVQRLEERNAEMGDELYLTQKRLKKALKWKKNLQNNVFQVVVPENIRDEVTEMVFEKVKQLIKESLVE